MNNVMRAFWLLCAGVALFYSFTQEFDPAYTALAVACLAMSRSINDEKTKKRL